MTQWKQFKKYIEQNNIWNYENYKNIFELPTDISLLNMADIPTKLWFVKEGGESIYFLHIPKTKYKKALLLIKN